MVLIRLYIGAVFHFEGIQKFLHPDDLGRAGRFDTAGIPAPGFFAFLAGASRSLAAC